MHRGRSILFAFASVVALATSGNCAERDASTYLGCFKDPNNPYDLSGYLERSTQNTPQRCISICKSRGFAYAGVQFGESCLCGKSYGKFGAADYCNYPCTGDNRQVCGGFNANSVYSTGLRR